MIDIKDLDFAYPRRQNLFKGLSVKLEDGSITGLLGKNGAGKTTLLKLITGALFPSAGMLSVLDHIPSKRDVNLLRDLYFVPEELHSPVCSINNYIRTFSPFYHRFDNSILSRILSQFELDPQDNLSRISHGQKKKFQIAFALSTKCRLLIFDEPTNGLDIPSKTLFRKVLAGSLDENQLVIISTHQVKDVESLIDRILILDEGKMIFREDLAYISQKVSCISGTKQDTEGAIYSEAIPGGFRMLIPTESSETEVDLELIFNAIVNGIRIS